MEKEVDEMKKIVLENLSFFFNDGDGNVFYAIEYSSLERWLKKKIFVLCIANNSRIWNYDLNEARARERERDTHTGRGRDGWVLVFWRGTSWKIGDISFLISVRLRTTILTKKELACATFIHPSIHPSITIKFFPRLLLLLRRLFFAFVCVCVASLRQTTNIKTRRVNFFFWLNEPRTSLVGRFSEEMDR